MLETQTEPGTGIRKRIEIQLAPDKPTLTLTHTLINDGMWAVELAPWAITQFRLGGTVILPMPVGNVGRRRTFTQPTNFTLALYTPQ